MPKSNSKGSEAELIDVLRSIIGTADKQKSTADEALLAQVNQLAKVKVPVAGTTTGIIPALVKKLRGGEFSPFSPREAGMGFEKAMQFMTLQESQAEGGRKAEIHPLEMRKREQDVSPEFQLGMEQSKENIRARSAETVDARKDLNKWVVGANMALNSLDKLEQAAVELGDFERGFFQQVGGRTDAAIQAFAKTREFSNFGIVLNQEGTNLAKNLGGVVGTQTEKDVARALQSIGSVTTPLEDKLAAIDLLRSPIASEFRIRREQARFSPQDYTRQFPQQTRSIRRAQIASGRTRNRAKAGEAETTNDKDTLSRLGLDPNRFEIVKD